jgi:hypothetical protein
VTLLLTIIIYITLAFITAFIFRFLYALIINAIGIGLLHIFKSEKYMKLLVSYGVLNHFIFGIAYSIMIYNFTSQFRSGPFAFWPFQILSIIWAIAVINHIENYHLTALVSSVLTLSLIYLNLRDFVFPAWILILGVSLAYNLGKTTVYQQGF